MQHGDGMKSYIILLINTFAFQFKNKNLNILKVLEAKLQIQRQLIIFLIPLAVSFLLMFYARHNNKLFANKGFFLQT